MFSFNVLLNDGSWEAVIRMLEYEWVEVGNIGE
jgi:hypothetical protein